MLVICLVFALGFLGFVDLSVVGLDRLDLGSIEISHLPVDQHSALVSKTLEGFRAN
ncbi:hypothetical protein Hdeb2414_s0016g00481951 [Helianthus debilis subsp. tardiflorus]